MSNEQDPNTVENEPKAADELSDQELEQVAGGSSRKGSANPPAPTSPPTESISLNFQKINVEYKPQ